MIVHIARDESVLVSVLVQISKNISKSEIRNKYQFHLLYYFIIYMYYNFVIFKSTYLWIGYISEKYIDRYNSINIRRYT